MFLDMSKDSDSNKSLWKEIMVAIIASLATVLISKACDRIAPGENKVIISDTLRIVETQTPRYPDDSLLYVAISELNKTIRETLPQNNNIKIVWPESAASSSSGRPSAFVEKVPSSENTLDKNTVKIPNPGVVIENHSYVNKIVDKKGFYKKGYGISDGGSFFVLNKIPKVNDNPLTFEIRLIQPAELLSHIYLNICTTNDKGELYQFFGQTYEIREGLNRIKIANNLREGKNRVEIGVFMKSEEGKDYPTFYRNLFSLVK